MRQTVYLDVLLSVNFLVDYFLLYATGQFARRSISRVRLCLGALLGAAGSCVILLPPMPFAADVLTRLLTASLMTLTAFGFGDIKTYLRTDLWLFGVTVCYGGIMLVLWLFAAPAGLIINNSAVYIDISPAMLIAFTVVLYGVLTFFSKNIRRRNLVRSQCSVTICSQDKRTEIDALVDTGNLLVEPFSGLPVIITEYDAVREVAPEALSCMMNGETPASADGCVRVIPCSSMGGESLLPAFRPAQVFTRLPGQPPRPAEAYIGVVENGKLGGKCRAIVNPDAVAL